MTDYIEDSLDRLEEEEERSWDWHEAAAVLSARSSEKSRQAAAQSQNGTAAPETAAVRERRREREPDLPASARSAAGGTQEPAESGTEWSGLEGTAPPGQPAAAGLYWGLARGPPRPMGPPPPAGQWSGSPRRRPRRRRASGPRSWTACSSGTPGDTTADLHCFRRGRSPCA